MGRRPVTPRSPGRSLGAIGRTTLADSTVGGGHDDLLRRALNQGGSVWKKARAALTFGGLEDVRVDYEDEGSEFAPAADDVPRWDPTIVTPYGGAWRPGPAPGAEPLTLGEWTDDGIFDELASFTFSQSITVSANSYQLVIVDAVAEVSDTELPVDADPVNGVVAAPTPWQLTVVDDTGAPGVVVGQNSISGGYCQVSMWVHNDTDDAASHSIFAVAGAVTPTYEFDATVEITIRTLYNAG